MSVSKKAQNVQDALVFPHSWLLRDPSSLLRAEIRAFGRTAIADDLQFK